MKCVSTSNGTKYVQRMRLESWDTPTQSLLSFTWPVCAPWCCRTQNTVSVVYDITTFVTLSWLSFLLPLPPPLPLLLIHNLVRIAICKQNKMPIFSISNPPLAHIFTFEWNAPTVTDMNNDPTKRNSIHRGDKIIQTGKEREVKMWVSVPSGREWLLQLIRANIARPNPIPFGQSSKSENRAFAAIVRRPEFRQK